MQEFSLVEEIEKMIEERRYNDALDKLSALITTSVDSYTLSLCFVERAKIWGILKEPHKMEEDINNATRVFYDLPDDEKKGKDCTLYWRFVSLCW